MKNKLIVLGLSIFLLWSCSTSKSNIIKINAVDGVNITDVIRDWGNNYGLVVFACEEYWSKKEPLLICLKTKNSENKVPGNVLYVSHLKEKTFYRVLLLHSTTSAQREQEKTLESFVSHVINIAGKNNVIVEK